MPGPIITRTQWGAEHPDGDGATVAQPAKEVWLHHSATQPPTEAATFDQDRAAVKLLEQIGQARFRAGISYNFLIPRSGRIFQGVSVTNRGTHTGGHNSVARSICLIGNYETIAPTHRQIDAIRWLLHRGVLAGWWARPLLTGGHRDVKATACPGRHAYERIPDMNIPWVVPPRPASPSPKPRPAPTAPLLTSKGDVVYIKCQPAPGAKIMTAIWNGPMFINLATPGEVKSAEGEIARGAVCQWVELRTWRDLDIRSRALCGTTIEDFPDAGPTAARAES